LGVLRTVVVGVPPPLLPVVDDDEPQPAASATAATSAASVPIRNFMTAPPYRSFMVLYFEYGAGAWRIVRQDANRRRPPHVRSAA
jgi:hypothetical protein